ncbi:nitroreductase family protein [Teredinibacter waterburyi]|uniref:nitroreductase family protein n=1 Tax=Teredinibacter waterburyi TaxID=1500538 RepID=UPI00165FAA6E|nr:nitroreductase family protein [Teredinibacter waterburyi]
MQPHDDMERLDYKEAWAMGTYRRFDSLDVPAFRPPKAGEVYTPIQSTRAAKLRLLDTHLPDTLLSLKDYLQGGKAATNLPFCQQLSLYLRYLAALQTFEPQNAYKVHTPVPSVRCLRPYRVMVVVAEDIPRLYQYHANYHALELIAEGEQFQHLLGSATLAIVGVAHYWQLADKYGEFSPFPVNLEIGGLKSQAEHLLTLLGWQQLASEIKPETWNQSLDCVDKLETTVFALPAKLPDATLSLATLPSVVRTLPQWQRRKDLTSRFSKLEALVALFQAPSANPIPMFSPAAAASPVTTDSDDPHHHIDILKLFRKRNSGNDAAGFAPSSKSLPADFLDKLLATFHALRARRPVYPGEDSVKLNFLWLDANSAPVALYDQDGVVQLQQKTGRELVTDMQAALPNKVLKFNMSAMTLSVLMTVDLAEAQTKHDDEMFRRVHIAAGMLAQDLNITATAFGLFSRPVRMFKENKIEHDLQFSGQLIYQVLMGFNRRTNYKIGLI